jgi:ABC-type lipopolysaccharide export system ATPase subunit
MAEGNILRSGQPEELVKDEDVRRLYLGERFTL